MKKSVVIVAILSTLLVILISMKKPLTTQSTRDYVPNEQTAIKIAEAIWLPIYGDDIYSNKPFKAVLKDGTVWVVKGTLHTELGGVPMIEIQKSDCKILNVSHGK